MKFKIVLLISLSVLALRFTILPAENVNAVSPTATPTDSPTPTLPTPKLKMEGTDGIDQTDIDDVMSGIALVQDFMNKHMGGDISEADLAKYSVNFGETTMSQGKKATGCCHTKDIGIYLDPHYVRWSLGPDALAVWPDIDKLFHMHTAAHEYIHLWQHNIGCMGEHYYYLPRWMIEGMADYVGWQVVIQAGYPNAKRFFDEYERDLARTVPLSVPLSYMEPRENEPPGGTALDDVALDVLIKQTPAGFLAFRQMCERTAAGEKWQTAFPSVFGMTVNAFYKEFEAERRNPIIKVGVSGTVKRSDGSPAAGYSVWVCAALDTVGTCHAVKVALDGTYKIAVPDGHYSVSLTPPYSDRNKLYTERNNLYYNSESPTHLTPYYVQLTVITVKGNLVTGIDMQETVLPVIGFTGIITDSNGKPLVNRLLTLCSGKPDDDCTVHGKGEVSFDYSAPDGSYFLRVPEGEYYLAVLCGTDYTLSYYSDETKSPVKDVSKASPVVVADNKTTKLNLTCPK